MDSQGMATLVRVIKETEDLHRQLWQLGERFYVVSIVWTMDHTRYPKDPDCWVLRAYASDESGATSHASLLRVEEIAPWQHDVVAQTLAERLGGGSITVGLFGTSGASRWRAPFVEALTENGIPFFDPQVEVEGWDPSMAEDEARHLATVPVLVVVVTDETYGTGSMVDVGMALTHVKGTDRQLVLYVEPTLDDDLDDPVARREAERARSLLIAHLRRLDMRNVHLTDSLDATLAECRRLT